MDGYNISLQLKKKKYYSHIFGSLLGINLNDHGDFVIADTQFYNSHEVLINILHVNQ